MSICADLWTISYRQMLSTRLRHLIVSRIIPIHLRRPTEPIHLGDTWIGFPDALVQHFLFVTNANRAYNFVRCGKELRLGERGNELPGMCC